MATLRKGFLPVIALAAAYYAIFGGEHSIFALRDTRSAIDEERQALLSLHGETDALAAWADSLENDLPTVERLARERYGMIRDGEVLYRFADEVDETSAPAGEPGR